MLHYYIIIIDLFSLLRHYYIGAHINIVLASATLLHNIDTPLITPAINSWYHYDYAADYTQYCLSHTLPLADYCHDTHTFISRLRSFIDLHCYYDTISAAAITLAIRYWYYLFANIFASFITTPLITLRWLPHYWLTPLLLSIAITPHYWCFRQLAAIYFHYAIAYYALMPGHIFILLSFWLPLALLMLAITSLLADIDYARLPLPAGLLITHIDLLLDFRRSLLPLGLLLLPDYCHYIFRLRHWCHFIVFCWHYINYYWLRDYYVFMITPLDCHCQLITCIGFINTTLSPLLRYFIVFSHAILASLVIFSLRSLGFSW